MLRGEEYSSFRDPSGKIYREAGVLFRKINSSYVTQYEKLMQSGLYTELTRKGVLVKHEEITPRDEGGITIQPELIPYISYPYEWSFSAYQDAALATLRIHRTALKYDMILKDASAYNIQFMQGCPLLIDTLSFEIYEEGAPWVAYGQFCRHFLAPLLLMAYVDVRLSKMMTSHIDGIPLDLAVHLLKGKGGMFALQHISWHAKATQKHSQDGRKTEIKHIKISKSNQIALIESLITGVERLRLKGTETEWGNYYANTNYDDNAVQDKQRLVRNLLQDILPKTVWDFGANDGRYSRIALESARSVVAFDIDPTAVEKNYQAVKKEQLAMLPLLLDLTNPSPSIGFANRERGDIASRQRPECILVLAVIHHIVISNNVPFEMFSRWLAELTEYLIIEFVPKEDSQVQILLATRQDIFPNYYEADFESAFLEDFELVKKEPINGNVRTIYLFKSKRNQEDER